MRGNERLRTEDSGVVEMLRGGLIMSLELLAEF